MARSVSVCCARPMREGGVGGARARRRGLVPEDLVMGRGVVPAGSSPAGLVVLVTTNVVRDTPPDRHFSAWSRPKPAPDPLPGPSVASGVIPTKGGRNGVLQPPAGRAPEGRWRSSPWNRCNHAAPRGRVRGHPAPLGALRPCPRGHHVPRLRQGLPRTARCIKTLRRSRGHFAIGASGSTPHRYSANGTGTGYELVPSAL